MASRKSTRRGPVHARCAAAAGLVGACLAGCVDWDAYRFRPAAGDAALGCRSDDAAPARLASPTGADWVLRWHDEFAGAALDTSRWSAADWCSSARAAQECYRATAATVADGCLRLTSTATPAGDRAYTSALVTTRSAGQLTYGRVEVRARLPRGAGVRPTISLAAPNDRWPPAVLITQLFGQTPDVAHLGVYWGTSDAPESAFETATGPDFSLAFHDYALEWEPGALRWYVDGAERFRTTSGVPAEPMDLALGTALGGDAVGPVDATTAFPLTYAVDYVRVYAR